MIEGTALGRFGPSHRLFEGEAFGEVRNPAKAVGTLYYVHT